MLELADSDRPASELLWTSGPGGTVVMPVLKSLVDRGLLVASAAPARQRRPGPSNRRYGAERAPTDAATVANIRAPRLSARASEPATAPAAAVPTPTRPASWLTPMSAVAARLRLRHPHPPPPPPPASAPRRVPKPAAVPSAAPLAAAAEAEVTHLGGTMSSPASPRAGWGPTTFAGARG